MLFENIKTLCQLSGVSGEEAPVRHQILEMIEGHCICQVDTMGNILAFKKGKKVPAHSILLSAHMDEVGLIVTYIEEDGMLRFSTVGGIDARTIPGKAVRIGEKQVLGVIGSKPVHLKSSEERDKASKVDSLYIDIGAGSKEEAQAQVLLGERAVFCSDYQEMGEGFLRGRALDDRAGCALLVELLRGEPLEFDVHVAFTVQEETGTTGAKVVANQIQPDMAIVVETTTACDIPDVPEEKTVCALRKGSVLSFMDRGTIYHKPLYEKAMEVAKAQKIPCQPKAGIYGGNEARSIQTGAGGSQVLAVSIPCRYLHTPSCVAHKEDIENTGKLLCALVGAFGQ